MSLAVKCDRCGDFFERPFASHRPALFKAREIRGDHVTIEIDDELNKINCDLCYTCVQRFIHFMEHPDVQKEV